MPFKSEAQRKWMYANKPEMAARWQKHTPKGKKLPKRVKKAMLGPLANIGAGAGKLFEMMSLPSWGKKMVELRHRATAGDEQAERLLSMLGVASVSLGSALGMGASKLFGEKRMMLGPALGGLMGAAPGLLTEDEPPVRRPVTMIA